MGSLGLQEMCALAGADPVGFQAGERPAMPLHRLWAAHCTSNVASSLLSRYPSTLLPSQATIVIVNSLLALCM